MCAATLVAELGSPETHVSLRQVLNLAEMNLAKKESGTSSRSRAKQRKRGRPLLRRQLILLAGRWCQSRGAYRAYYEAMKARNGNSKTKALCAVARKLVPMLLQVVQTAQPFDEGRWRATKNHVVFGGRPQIARRHRVATTPRPRRPGSDRTTPYREE